MGYLIAAYVISCTVITAYVLILVKKNRDLKSRMSALKTPSSPGESD